MTISSVKKNFNFILYGEFMFDPARFAVDPSPIFKCTRFVRIPVEIKFYLRLYFFHWIRVQKATYIFGKNVIFPSCGPATVLRGIRV